MKTYSYGTTPGDVIAAALPHKYPIELNRTDMRQLLCALASASWADAGFAEWAHDMRTSILETLGIEEL